MGTVIDKVQYTKTAIDDITRALQEKGFDISQITLIGYGDIIRSLKSATSDEENTEVIVVGSIALKNAIICNPEKSLLPYPEVLNYIMVNPETFIEIPVPALPNPIDKDGLIGTISVEIINQPDLFEYFIVSNNIQMFYESDITTQE